MELAQAAQVATQASGLALLGTALTLGLRHGIDWDHIAAIGDITGASLPAHSQDGSRSAGTVTRNQGRQSPARPGAWKWSGASRNALGLASLYAAGHALVVVPLGLGALYFRAILPEWLDPLMERVVGATLLILGAWVVYSLVRYWRGRGDWRLRSRWMLIFAGAHHLWRWLAARTHGHNHSHSHTYDGTRHVHDGTRHVHDGTRHVHDGMRHVHRVDGYGPRTAFGTGVIHGIGAETGTQVLVIAAVGGASTQGLGTGMLLAFVAGLLLSNTAVAFLASAGFMSAGRVKALYLLAGGLAAAFSLTIGSYAILGMSDQLPDLPAAIASLLGLNGAV